MTKFKVLMKILISLLCVVYLIIPSFCDTSAEEAVYGNPAFLLSSEKQYAFEDEQIQVRVHASAGENPETFEIEAEGFNAQLSDRYTPDENGAVSAVTEQGSDLILRKITEDLYQFSLEAGETADFDLVFEYAGEKEETSGQEEDSEPADYSADDESVPEEEITEETDEESDSEEPVSDTDENGAGGASDFSDSLIRNIRIPLLEENPYTDTTGSLQIHYGISGQEKETLVLIWVSDEGLQEQTLAGKDTDPKVILKGILPAEGYLEVESAENLEVKGQRIITAADISVFFPSGVPFEPYEETEEVVLQSRSLSEFYESSGGEAEVNIYYAASADEELTFLDKAVVKEDGSVAFEADHFSVYAVTVQQAAGKTAKLAAPRLRAPSGAQEADLDFAEEGIFEINLFDYTAVDDSYAELDPYSNTNIWQDKYKSGINVDQNGNWRNLLFYPSGIHKGYGQPYTINNYTGGNNPTNDSNRGGITYYPAALQGIVRDELKNGYPELAYGFRVDYGTGVNVPLNSGDAAASLEYLFNPSDTSHNGNRTDYLGLEHLFYKEDGSSNKYRFDSSQYYAYIPDTSTNEFTVYQTDQKPLGFFPLNDYDSSKTSANLAENFNHQFGMTMKADFTIGENGLIQTTNADGETEYIEEKFTFTGDDDVWVFIDGKLVLDLGGVHKPLMGTINFATGDVTLDLFENIMTSDGSEVIYPKAVHVGDTIDQTGPGDNPPEHIVQSHLSDILPDYDTKPYEKHTIQIFYMERGGCDSNLRLEMDMDFAKTFTAEKEVTGSTAEDHMEDEFEYRFFLQKISDGRAVGDPELVTDPNTHLNDPVVPKNDWKIKLYKVDTSGNKTLITPDPQTGIFKLKHGETIEIRGLPGNLNYYLQEISVDTDVYPHTNAYDQKGQKLDLTVSEEDEKKIYSTDTSDILSRKYIKYVNDTGITVPVTKVWKDMDGNVIDLTAADYEAEFGDTPVTFTLLRKTENDEAFEEAGRTITLPKSGGTDIWQDEFRNLPETDDEGNLYIYTVKENSLAGYETTVETIQGGTETHTEIITTTESLGTQFVPVTDRNLVSGETYVFVNQSDNRPMTVPNYGAQGFSYGSAVSWTSAAEGETITDESETVSYTQYASIPVQAQFRWDGSQFIGAGDGTIGPNGKRGHMMIVNWPGFAYYPAYYDNWYGTSDIWHFTGDGVGRLQGNPGGGHGTQFVKNDFSLANNNGDSQVAHWQLLHAVELVHTVTQEVTTEEVIPDSIQVTNKKIPVIDIPFIKTGTKLESGGSPASLEGAEFDLEDASGNVIGSDVSAGDGSFGFEKVPVGDGSTIYYLRETKAPVGYMLPSVRWEIKVIDKDTYQIRKEGADDSSWETVNVGDTYDPYQIKNLEIYNLPSAGRSGTYMYTIFGTAVFMFAILRYLNERKRGKRHGCI